MGSMSKANQRQGKAHKPGYDRYRNGMQREINKAKRLARHLARFPWDQRIVTLLRSGMSQLAIARAKVKLPDVKAAESPRQMRAKNNITLTQIKRLRKLRRQTVQP